MPATMATQGGRVQMEPSNMRQALNMAKMAKEGFLRTAMEQRKYLIMKPQAEVPGEQKLGVEFPGHKKVKVAIKRHPAMLRQNHMSGCLHCQNGTTKNPDTCWRHKGTGAPPPDQRRQPTPAETPPLPGTPSALAVNNCGAQ